jgi:uncharacterized protein (DUF433 family)
MFRLFDRMPPEFFPPWYWFRPRHLIAEHPAVVKTPDVCGGSARIIRTRIPVWTLERMRQLGLSEIDILRSYPSLKAIDLVQAWSYADAHRDEIEREIRENEEE